MTKRILLSRISQKTRLLLYLIQQSLASYLLTGSPSWKSYWRLSKHGHFHVSYSLYFLENNIWNHPLSTIPKHLPSKFPFIQFPARSYHLHKVFQLASHYHPFPFSDHQWCNFFILFVFSIALCNAISYNTL